MNVINGVGLYMDGFKGSDADIVLSMNKIEKVGNIILKIFVLKGENRMGSCWITDFIAINFVQIYSWPSILYTKNMLSMGLGL